MKGGTLRHLDHKAARRTIAVERSAVEAAKPKKARAKEGTGFERAEFTGAGSLLVLSSMGEKPRARGERREDAEKDRQEMASHGCGPK